MDKQNLLIVITFLATSLFAQIPVKVREAFNNFEADSVYNYAYHKKTTDPDGSMLESYNPMASKGKWQLLTVNNEQAAPERIKNYDKEKNISADPKRESRRFEFNENTMQDFQIMKETDDEIVFSFNLITEENDKIDQLKGKITLQKDPGWIQRIIVYNQAPFSPALPVKIYTFRMNMEYQRLKDTNAIKLKTIQTRIKARAFVFKKIDTKVTEEYYNYKLIK